MIGFQDAVFHEGNYYAVTSSGEFVLCTLSPIPKVSQICRVPKALLMCWSKYIVDLGDSVNGKTIPTKQLDSKLICW